MTAPRIIEIIGHGGAAAFHPGNTAASIEKALEIGVDRVELDVRVSGDRQLVLLHDDELSQLGTNALASMTPFDDLKTCINGWIRLEEAQEIVGGRVPLLIDIKGRGYEPELIEAIGRFQTTGEVTASSTHARSLRQLHYAFPDMRLGLSRGHSLTRLPIQRLRRVTGAAVSGLQLAPLFSLARWCGASELMIQYHLCNSVILQVARAQGFRIYPWTVDSPRDIHRIAQLAVDGIISNRPDLVAEELQSSLSAAA